VRTTNPVDQYLLILAGHLRAVRDGEYSNRTQVAIGESNESFIVCGHIDSDMMDGTCSTCGEREKNIIYFNCKWSLPCGRGTTIIHIPNKITHHTHRKHSTRSYTNNKEHSIHSDTVCNWET
jgi:hypothetical protein